MAASPDDSEPSGVKPTAPPSKSTIPEKSPTSTTAPTTDGISRSTSTSSTIVSTASPVKPTPPTAPPIAIRPSTAPKPAPIRTPAPANKMAMASIISPSPSATSDQPLTMTSKEWVIPPRPKPGRKPATDTPPTKRKAQNRAAQRAFRERRAARIGELEEQLDDQKDDHERTVRELQARISHLEIETQTLQSRCQWLEGLLEKERQARPDAQRSWTGRLQSVPSRSGSLSAIPLQPTASSMGSHHPRSESHSARASISTSTSLTGPGPSVHSFSISEIISPPDDSESLNNLTCGSCGPNGSCACADAAMESTASALGCGKCSIGTRCQCLEESIASATVVELKRPHPPPSPSIAVPEKRQRSDADVAMETDFTTMFASKKRIPATESYDPQPPVSSQSSILASVEPRDSCGFCKDGTYCVCADSMNAGPPLPIASAAPISQQTQTPPPSENDVVPTPMEITSTGAVKLPSLQSLHNARSNNALQPAQPRRVGGCGPNGPGTCAQCLSDPMSGLFCRSLAANFEKTSASANGGCCGSGGPGGCCKSGKTDAPKPSASAPAASGGLGLSISCADAYKTLSSHRHFNEAADEIGTWLPKLKVAPIADPAPSRPARLAPMEVEAASIMSVLKGFDVRFGRGQ